MTSVSSATDNATTFNLYNLHYYADTGQILYTKLKMLT